MSILVLNLAIWLFSSPQTTDAAAESQSYPVYVHTTSRQEEQPKCTGTEPCTPCTTNDCVASSPVLNPQNPNISNPFGPSGNPLLFFTDPKITVAHATVRAIWQSLLLVVDAFIVVLVVMNGLTILLGGTVLRYAKVIEALPNILLALISSHCSLFFISVLLGFNNTLSADLYNWAGSKFVSDNHLVTQGPTTPNQVTTEAYENVTDDHFTPQPDATGIWDPKYIFYPYNGNPMASNVPGAKALNVQDALRAITSREGLPADENAYNNIHANDVSTASLGALKAIQQSAPPSVRVIFTLDDLVVPDRSTYKPHSIILQPVTSCRKTSHSQAAELVAGTVDEHKHGGQIARDGGRGDIVINQPGGAWNLTVEVWSCNVYGTSHPLFQPDNSAQITLDFSSLINFDGTANTALASLQHLTDIFPLVTKVLALMLLAQLILRFFFLNFYIVLSPLGLAAWAMPGKIGQPLTRLWLSGFLSTLLVQVLQVVAILVTQMMLGAILTAMTGYLGIPTDLNAQTAIQSTSQQTLANIMQVAILWFIFRIPSLLGTAPMRSMVDVGQAVTQVASAGLSMQVQSMQMAVSSANIEMWEPAVFSRQARLHTRLHPLVNTERMSLSQEKSITLQADGPSTPAPPTGSTATGNSFTDVYNFALAVKELLVKLGWVIFFIGISIAGIMRMISFGSVRKIEISNLAIAAAVIGLAIILGASGIASVITTAFGGGGP
jgi:hypothetical protein